MINAILNSIISGKIGEGGTPPPVETYRLILENGDSLLLENSDSLLLESSI